MQITRFIDHKIENLNYKDTFLLKQAMKQRWPIKQSTREQIVNGVSEIAENGEEPNQRLRAIKLLIELDKLNLRQDEIDSMNKPKTIIHGDLTTEQIQQLIRERMGQLSLTDDDRKLIEGKISDGTTMLPDCPSPINQQSG